MKYSQALQELLDFLLLGLGLRYAQAQQGVAPDPFWPANRVRREMESRRARPTTRCTGTGESVGRAVSAPSAIYFRLVVTVL